MNMPGVFLTRRIREEGLALLRGNCHLDIWEDDLPPSREKLLERAKGIEGLLCLLSDRIDAQVMDAAGPALKVISNHAVGFDNIDLEAARQRGIKVGNTPGILTDATADFTFALLLAAARRVVEGDHMVREGRWKTWGPSILLGPDLVGSTLGIVGFGRIGQAVARRALGFEMRVLYTDRSAQDEFPELNARKIDLESLLRESDFISLHIPLTPETQGLMDEQAFSLVKPGAVLVNTARGGVIDQSALYQALKGGRLFAAAIDVSDPEPLPLDSPLLELENLIITPHIASASYHSRNQMAVLSAKNLLAGLRGEPLPYEVVG